MGSAISTFGLSKNYGKKTALVDLDLEVLPGEIFGYLGPNGAGKSTTIRLLMDFIRPTRGRAEILGLDTRAQSIEVRRRVGYLPGELALYEDMTGLDLLTYLGNLRGGVDRAYVHELAERLELELDRRIRTLSRGNKQKVGLVQALMHRPELVILDEPTSGLDPLIQHAVHNLLEETREEGRTIFMSSHALSEVEAIADRVGIIRRGQLAAVESVKTLKQRAVRRIDVSFTKPPPPNAFSELPGVKAVEADGHHVRFTIEGIADPVIKAIAPFEVASIVSHEADLEEVFLTFYETGERNAE